MLASTSPPRRLLGTLYLPTTHFRILTASPSPLVEQFHDAKTRLSRNHIPPLSSRLAHIDLILAQPGWTLQERLLPSRVVHYARDQMYFECESLLQAGGGFCLENEFISLPRLLGTQGIRGNEHGSRREGLHFAFDSALEGIRWKGGWVGLVQDYSQRKLTVPNDKLPALSGLARIVAERTHDCYFAGLWAAHFYEDLFWRVYVQEETYDNSIPVKGKVIGEAKKPAQYRAPSWSWASIDAPIRFIPLAYQYLVARVVKCETNPGGSDIYSIVKDGRLVIEGPVFEIFPHETNKNGWERHGISVEVRFETEDERANSVGALFLDMPNQSLQFPCFALFIDPGNALVLRPRRGRPTIAPGEIPGYSGDGHDEIDYIVTSADVRRQVKMQPETKDCVFQAYANTERIGVVSFVRGIRPEDMAKDVDQPVDMSNATPDDILKVRGGESWGPITNEDPKVRVAII